MVVGGGGKRKREREESECACCAVCACLRECVVRREVVVKSLMNALALGGYLDSIQFAFRLILTEWLRHHIRGGGTHAQKDTDRTGQDGRRRTKRGRDGT